MPNISVHIQRNAETQDIEINAGGRELPGNEAIIAQLTAAEQRNLGYRFRGRSSSYYRRTSPIQSIIAQSTGISLERWAQAICAAMIRAEREALEGATATDINGNEQMRAAIEQQSLLDKTPPTLLVGDTLYHLQPVKKVVPAARSLSVFRQQVKRSAEAECAELRRAAQAEADLIIQQANTKLAEAETIKRQAAEQNRFVMPFDGLWSRNRERIEVGRWMQFRIERFTSQYGIYHEETLRRENGTVTWTLPSPVVTPLMLCWLPLSPTGAYDITQLHLDSGLVTHYLPHMTTGSACVRPEGVPSAITHPDHLRRVMAGVERAFRTVNMSSLLSHDDSWLPCIRTACPRECLDFYAGNIDAASITEGVRVPLEQEAQNTWTAEEPTIGRPRAAAAPEWR